MSKGPQKGKKGLNYGHPVKWTTVLEYMNRLKSVQKVYKELF